MKAISTSGAPTPAGHYSQAIVHGDLVFVSGQLPIDAETGERIIGSIEVQTLQALENLAAILRSANSGIDLVQDHRLCLGHSALGSGRQGV